MTVIKDVHRGMMTHKNMTRAFSHYNWDGPLMFNDLLQGRIVTSIFNRDEVGVITGTTTIDEYPDFVSPQITYYNDKVIAKLLIGEHGLMTTYPVEGFGKLYLKNLMRRITAQLRLPHKSTIERDELLGLLENDRHVTQLSMGKVYYNRVYDMPGNQSMGVVRRFESVSNHQHDHVGRWYIDGLGDIYIGNFYDRKFKLWKMSGLPLNL